MLQGLENTEWPGRSQTVTKDSVNFHLDGVSEQNRFTVCMCTVVWLQVMHNGTTTIDAYGQNLDKLKVGDRVGVVRRDSGVIHFYVNGEDQGPAATNVPERIYGVIDLYGQAAQVGEVTREA